MCPTLHKFEFPEIFPPTLNTMYNTHDDMLDYHEAFGEFLTRLREFERLASELVAVRDLEIRGKRVYQSDFHRLVMRFNNRRRGPFLSEEITLWRAGINLLWKMVPADVLGLYNILEWLAEESETSDLLVLLEDDETRCTLKAIAQSKYERLFGKEGFGGMIAASAKTVLARQSKECSYSQATTSRMGAAQARIHEGTEPWDSLENQIARMFVPVQPARRGNSALSSEDMRRVCDADSCTQVEGLSKFKKCSRCMKVAYCSAVCQKRHWTNHKLVCSKAIRKPSIEASVEAPATTPAVGAQRVCTDCHISKPLVAFSKSQLKKKAAASRCIICVETLGLA